MLLGSSLFVLCKLYDLRTVAKVKEKLAPSAAPASYAMANKKSPNADILVKVLVPKSVVSIVPLSDGLYVLVTIL